MRGKASQFRKDEDRGEKTTKKVIERQGLSILKWGGWGVKTGEENGDRKDEGKGRAREKKCVRDISENIDGNDI